MSGEWATSSLPYRPSRPAPLSEDDNKIMNLHEAVKAGNASAIDRVLDQYPELVHSLHLNERPLHWAMQKGQSQSVQALLKHGADPNAISREGYTPLMVGLSQGHTRNMAILLKAGAVSNTGELQRGSSILDFAIENVTGDQLTTDALHLMIAYGALLHDNISMKSLLSRAIDYRKPLSVLVLCAFLVKPSPGPAQNPADYGLVERLEDESFRNKVRKIIHKWGIRQRDMECRQILREYIEPDGRLDYSSLLAWAAQKGKMETLEYILDMNVNPEFIDTRVRGWNAIHFAAKGGESKVIPKLLERGAFVDSLTEPEKLTPLLIASEKGRQRTVRVLLQNGANVFAETQDGRSAFDIAWNGNHSGTAAVLDEFISKIENPRSRQLAQSSSAKAKGQYASPMANARPAQPKDYLTASQTDSAAGTFDGFNYSLPTTSSNFKQPRTFVDLIETHRKNFEFHEKDGIVKIAILDTGIDTNHEDFSQPRALRFENGQPISDESGRAPKQIDLIKGCKNFCGDGRAESDTTDLDGHGTAVAGIILRLAPRSEFYIARVCTGGSAAEEPRRPQPSIVARAIDWAIEQQVDLINMSFGFDESDIAVKTALKRARNHCIVFAATSNEGNFKRMAWPARDENLVIGIHSSNSEGTKPSDFTPPPSGRTNIMVVGEDILTHWPTSKGGGFRPYSGTSFSTPVAVAMAALILAFVRQKRCSRERTRLEEFLVDLPEISGMRKVLQKISNPVASGHYQWIHPDLLWKDFKTKFEDEEGRRAYAWRMLRDALDE
ncbi:hypothetical protein JX266_011582 [Neoarthrinium moseri]|nr:hypothetical protein JX266_011582 [Neoarthrinium moseri]